MNPPLRQIFLSKNKWKHSANILWGKGIRHNPIFNIHSYFTINGHIFLLFLEYVEEIGGKKWAMFRQHAIVMTLHNYNKNIEGGK